MKSKVGDIKLEEDIVEYLREANEARNVEDVRKHFKIGWGTARAILLKMAKDNNHG